MSADSYDDGLVQLDREAITLRRYHFPSGTSKIIALQHVRGYKAEPLGLLMHRFRIWGSSDLRRWLPLDMRPAVSVDADHARCAGHPAQPGVHAGQRRTSSPHCWIACSTNETSRPRARCRPALDVPRCSRG